MNAPQKINLNSHSNQRLISLDALRGFDMFWIIGADSLVYALHRLSPNKFTGFLMYELSHSLWTGLHFYDLIFPLFVFMAGVSLVFSLTKTIQRSGRGQAVKRIVSRSVLLFLLGIFYYGGLSHAWPDIRLMGVLNRIALAYFFTGLLFCFFPPRVLAGVCIALLLGYWALMAYIPIRNIQLTTSGLVHAAQERGDRPAVAALEAPGNASTIKNSPAWAAAEKLFYATHSYVTGQYRRGLNVCNQFDFQYLPGWKWYTYWDPEGFLSTIPAIATCLLGVFAGLLLSDTGSSDKRKLVILFAGGLLLVVLGWSWGLEFPVIKKIWTSSYVLVAGGYSALLLGTFYLIVDVWKFQKWCQPFIWVGMNPLTIYLADNILGEFTTPAKRFVGGNVKTFLDTHIAAGLGELLICLTGLLLAFTLARFLYTRKIFIRL